MPAPHAEAVPHRDVPQVQSSKPAAVDRLAQLQAEAVALAAEIEALASAPVAPEPVVPAPAPVETVAPVNPTPVAVSSTVTALTPVPAPAVASAVSKVETDVKVTVEEAVTALDKLVSFVKGGLLKVALALAIFGTMSFILIGQAKPAQADEVCDTPWSAVEAKIENSGLHYSELSYIQRAAILAHVETDATITHIYAVVVPDKGLVLVFVAGDCVEGVAPVSQEAFDAVVKGTGV